jgi:hypothetical protein
MNPWIKFIKQFYAMERKHDKTKCRDSGTLKRVAKKYHCMKKLDNKTRKNTDKFRGTNPMFKKRK